MRKIRMKTWILLTASMMLLAVLSGCAGGEEESPSSFDVGRSDLEYVQAKETLIVGITEFAPMDYLEGEKWIGFDADLARAFAEELGVTAEFVEIDWGNKTKLLETGSIDCIWNGMTMTDELQSTISCSAPYLSNAQVIVLRAKDVKQYPTVEFCNHLLFAVEAGSAGEALLAGMKYRYTVYGTQLEALQSVQDKQADAAVIDSVMAAYYINEEQKFHDLDFNIPMNDEKICAGFRKDSDLTEKANAFLEKAYASGTIRELAGRYDIENAMLED